MQQQKHHLAAILFTDIVGYTAIMQKDQLQAVAVIRRYNAVLEKLVAEHLGEVVNNYGDGSLCTFTSAREAVKCAIEIQEQLKNEPTVPLRIGLHIGEIFFEDGQVFGDGVNVASRIQSLGRANTILFSGEINNKIKNQPEFKSVSIGHFEFKNVDEAVEVFALANEGLVIPQKAEMTGKLKEAAKNFSVKKIILSGGVVILLIIALLASQNFFSKKEIINKDKSIAVLPFNNLSINKEENEPFCIGVTLELQKNLAWMSELMPIAPQSVEKYRDTKMSIADIAGELGGIKYIVQGTVQRDKNKIKVFASLIDAINGKQLWSDNYPGVVEDIFSLQENIAQQIASALQVNITPEEKRRIERIPTKNTKAWDVFNEAQMRFVRYAFSINPNETDYGKIQSLCDKTLQLDSNLAEAYVLKARAYWIANYKKEFFSKNFMDTVERLCQKALEIDNSSVDALVQLSDYFNRTGKKELALKQLQKAITLNPNSFAANWALGTGNPELY